MSDRQIVIGGGSADDAAACHLWYEDTECVVPAALAWSFRDLLDNYLHGLKTLTCDECSLATFAPPATPRSDVELKGVAYAAGWRFPPVEGGTRSLCPECAGRLPQYVDESRRTA